MVYFTAGRGEENQRIVHPYHLTNIRGEWHLIAYDRLRQDVRQFALPRIRRWRVLTGEHFAIDPHFSLTNYFGQSFLFEHGGEPAEVVIHFDPYQARYIRERQWHPSQQIEEQPDGSLILHLTVAALGEVQRWIMGYGSHARVLAPVALAQAIATELRAALAKYADLQ